MNKLILMVMVTFFSTLANAQDKPEMADVMRSNGKIYDVVAVCLTILIGLFIYVFIIDRKISKIEKNK
jgi:tetrahydromethanopterin S-methyltransferase subunit D